MLNTNLPQVKRLVNYMIENDVNHLFPSTSDGDTYSEVIKEMMYDEEGTLFVEYTDGVYDMFPNIKNNTHRFDEIMEMEKIFNPSAV